MGSPRDSLSLTNLRAWDQLYGNTRTLVWGDAPIGFLEEFLPALEGALGPSPRVLDAATGEGRNLSALLRLNAELHACDSASHALDKIPGHLRRRVHATACDLYAMPYGDGSFDAALMADVIETLPIPSRALREIHRILKPGGRLLCNIPGLEDQVAGIDMSPIGTNRFLFQNQYFYRFYTEEQAITLLTASGFGILRNEIRSWSEDPHPGFRGNWHWHTSRVFLVEKR
jgi:SAM-dependent methyltransferase